MVLDQARLLMMLMMIMSHTTDFMQLARESVTKCEHIKNRLVSGQVQPGVETIQQLDSISNNLCLAIDAAELARNVHYRQVKQAVEMMGLSMVTVRVCKCFWCLMLVPFSILGLA